MDSPLVGPSGTLPGLWVLWGRDNTLPIPCPRTWKWPHVGYGTSDKLQEGPNRCLLSPALSPSPVTAITQGTLSLGRGGQVSHAEPGAELPGYEACNSGAAGNIVLPLCG